MLSLRVHPVPMSVGVRWLKNRDETAVDVVVGALIGAAGVLVAGTVLGRSVEWVLSFAAVWVVCSIAFGLLRLRRKPRKAAYAQVPPPPGRPD